MQLWILNASPHLMYPVYPIATAQLLLSINGYTSTWWSPLGDICSTHDFGQYNIFKAHTAKLVQIVTALDHKLCVLCHISNGKLSACCCKDYNVSSYWISQCTAITPRTTQWMHYGVALLNISIWKQKTSEFIYNERKLGTSLHPNTNPARNTQGRRKKSDGV